MNIFQAPYVSQQLGDYKMTQTISTGFGSQTYLAQSKYVSDEQYIVSRFPLSLLQDPSMKEHFIESSAVLLDLSQYNESEQYIIRCATQFIDHDYMYFLFDYHPTTELQTLLIRSIQIEYPIQKQLCYGLIRGLTWVHKHNNYHGNVGSRSVWIGTTNMRPYWIDFGLAIPRDPIYYSPEVAAMIKHQELTDESRSGSNQISVTQKQASDVWSLGVLLTQLMYRRLPMLGEDVYMDSLQNETALIDVLAKAQVVHIPQTQTVLPPNADQWDQFIRWILNPIPAQRPLMPTILATFEANLLLN